MANISESFTGSNSTTSPGTNWTTQGSHSMGISGNAAFPGSADPNICQNSHNTPMDGDDPIITATVGGTIGTGTPNAKLYACSGSDVQCYVQASLGAINIATSGAWGGTAVARATNSVTVTAGDTFGISRNGNIFTAYHNGSALGTSWNDSGGIVPRDSSHRTHGIGGKRQTAGSGGGSMTIDNYSAVDTGIFPSGIASAEAFGTPTVAFGDATVAPSGIASTEAFGAPAVGLTGTISPSGIPSGEAFGAATVTPGAVTLAPAGIGSAEAFGTAWINGPAGPARAKLDAGQDVVLMDFGDSTGFGAFDAEPPATPTTGTTKHGSFGRMGLDLGDEYDANVVVKQFSGTAWGSPTTLRSSVFGSSQTITLLSGAIDSQALVNQESFLSTNLLQYASTADLLIGYEGINDVDVSDLDAADFVSAYQHFIEEVRAAEPNLPIVITTENPTTYTNESQFAANFSALATAYVGAAIPLSPPLQRSPVPNVWVLDTRQAFNGYTLSTLIYNVGATVHPNYLGYKVLADWMSFQLFGISVGFVAPTGIDSAEAFGSPTVAPGSVDVAPSGIASGEAFGTPAMGSAGTIAPAGIPTAEAFGSPAITTGAVSVAPVSIGSAEAFGVPTVAGQTTPSAPTPASRTLVVAADSRTLTVQP